MKPPSPSSAQGRPRALTVQRLITLLFPIAVFAMAVQPAADGDTWWHLKSGQLIWESGEMLRTDPFSHTMAGQPWINHGWLAQVIFWPVYQIGGLAGLSLLVAVLVTAAWALVYERCEGQPYVAAFAALLGAIASSVIWTARPQIITLLLASITAWLLDRFRRTGTGWVWLIPPLVAVWANCHGGWVVALILLGCHVIGESLDRLVGAGDAAGPNWRTVRTLVAVAVASALLAGLNPYGFRMWVYPLETVNIGPLQAFIQEWSSPDFHRLIFHPFIWLLLLALAAMALSRRRASWIDLALVAAFGYLSLLAGRNVALFALVTAPILADYGSDALRAWPQLRPIVHPPLRPPNRLQVALNATLLGLVVLGAGAKTLVVLARVDDATVWGEGLPVAAVDWLAGNPQSGQMLNSYNWGGYLIWALYPDEPVFVDGRTDLYSLDSRILEDYATVHWIRPGWREVLDRYGVGFVLTERTGLLDVLLAETDDWEQVYADGVASIYRRAETSP